MFLVNSNCPSFPQCWAKRTRGAACSKYSPRVLTTHTFPWKTSTNGAGRRGRHRVPIHPQCCSGPFLIALRLAADLQALEGVLYEGFCQSAGRPRLPFLVSLWFWRFSLSPTQLPEWWVWSLQLTQRQRDGVCVRSGPYIHSSSASTVSDTLQGRPRCCGEHQFRWINSRPSGFYKLLTRSPW